MLEKDITTIISDNKLLEYTSFEEKKTFFTSPQKGGSQYLFETKEDIDLLLKTYTDRNDFKYRGLNNSRYKLYSSGQRFWLTNNLKHKFVSYLEFIKSIIASTKEVNGSTISKFLEIFGDKDDDITVLSFIKHFGGPTPFIDFTSDVRVALYFACQPCKQLCHDINEEIDNYISLYLVPVKHDLDSGEEVDFWNAPWLTIANSRETLSKEDKVIFDRGIKKIELFFAAAHGFEHKFRAMYFDKYMMEKFKFNFITNMNILNQKGLFFFLSEADMPLEQIIHEDFDGGVTEQTPTKFMQCLHINQDLTPYLMDKISVDTGFIFPDPKAMIAKVCDDALNKIALNYLY